MWKYLNESVEGTSHRSSGAPCQDFSFVTPYMAADEEVLILACADGAGSAACSQYGSRTACETIAKQAASFLESGRVVDELDEESIRTWVRSVHHGLEDEGAQRGVPPRQLACTLLFAVVGKNSAAFCQIGDGAIIIRENGSFRPIFWPQNGEYQNTTFFVTDREFEQQLQVHIVKQPIDEVALLTDGLQMLALDFTERAAHPPFFLPMFESLRAAADRQDLIVPMRQFLDSKAVNDRTDDDKTLVLAARVTSADATV